jgi:hypothetical protein
MNRVGVAVVALAIAVLVAGVVGRHLDPFGVKALIAHPSAAQLWTETAEKALKRVTVGTRYATHWQIGRPPRSGWLSVILVDSDQPRERRLAPALHRNCTYTGSRDLIVCDVALIRHFLAERDLDKTVESSFDKEGYVTGHTIVPLPRDQLESRYFDMLQWILGHELGHVLNGDGQAHFTSDRLDDPVRAVSIDQKRELAADGFLARQFGPGPGADSDFYMFLISILQNEINRKACPGQSPVLGCQNTIVGMLIFSPKGYVRYSTNGTHPEYLIRMDRLLILGDEQHNLGIIGPLARGLKRNLLEEGAAVPKR